MKSRAVESYVKKYGEKYRRLIADALAYLDNHEAEWNLKKPVDREDYIRSLVGKAK